MKIAYAAAVAAALVLAPAEASPITYTLTGTMDGVLGKGGFSNVPFTIIGKGDTAGLVFPAGPHIPAVPLSSMKITYNVFGPQTLTATDKVFFFANHLGMSAGFADITALTDPVDFRAAAFWTYNAVSSISPIAVTPHFSSSVMTDRGEFTFLHVSSLTFGVVRTDAVPEPGTFLILAAGLLGLGWSVRRRAQVG